MKSRVTPAVDSKISFSLPELPSVIRYYDDFNDCPLSIRNPKDINIWAISVGGSDNFLDFNCHGKELVFLLKSWIAFLIQTLATATVVIRFSSLLRVSRIDIELVVNSTPTEIQRLWQSMFAKGYTGLELSSLKSILHFFCKCNLAGWSSDYSAFLSTLPLPAQDKYSSVRTGDVFLSLEEETILITYFDELSKKIQVRPTLLSDNVLRDVTILICSYQFGLRPIQIGMLQMRDVRIWKDHDYNALPSVHLTFKMVKQRSRSRSLPLPRKVKHDWALLFIELYDRARRNGLGGSDRIFQTSAQETAQIIVKVTGQLLPESRSATELRHTAAQRLVDAGASQEELAEFLGHSDTDTGLVYFQTSPNQAERVNRALGISEIYQQVAKIAHERFISLEELSVLKGEQQIGGAPHGISITGIGGCSTGQPSCPYNPVMACYGCRKFMPVNDIETHKKALEDFRSVVSFFSRTAGSDQNAPAYLQLQRTISSVQAIIFEIGEGL